MKRLIIPAISAFVCSVALTLQAQPITATVDFEGLNEGDIVDTLTLDAGYTAPENLGSIGVVGTQSTPIGVVGTQPTPGGNAAMIFDSDCPDGCSGDDSDLNSKSGKVLIITEDFNRLNPDDNSKGGTLDFDFTTLFAGAADIVSLQITDTEAGGTIEFYNGLDLLTTIDLPKLENGQTEVVPINVSGVTRMRVTLVESGSVDSIELRVQRVNFGGCTPGFWSQRALRAHYWAATGYAPGASYYDTFGFGPQITLLQALTARGNTDGQALLRHSTAALLNAGHPEIHYPFTEAQIIAVTEAAWAGTKSLRNEVKDTFDDANNGGCFD